jgi:uncharacterized protein involved in high-affinity Fe2+ transport
MTSNNQIAGLIACLVAIPAASASAAEHSMGNPVVVAGMILRPVYLQPVHMAPMLPGMDAASADAHLEIDIHADKNNPQGFEPGAWLPYLTVSYQIQKLDSKWSTFGTLMAMTASDGPHYGANIKFHGPGKYRASFRIDPPPYHAFLRHTDKETGVREWWGPIEESWDFTYVGGVGHKGGY